MAKYAVRLEWTMDLTHFVDAATPNDAAEIARALPIDWDRACHLGLNIAEVYDESNGEMVYEI
jgi:hypothetical protein